MGMFRISSLLLWVSAVSFMMTNAFHMSRFHGRSRLATSSAATANKGKDETSTTKKAVSKASKSPAASKRSSTITGSSTATKKPRASKTASAAGAVDDDGTKDDEMMTS